MLWGKKSYLHQLFLKPCARVEIYNIYFRLELVYYIKYCCSNLLLKLADFKKKLWQTAKWPRKQKYKTKTKLGLSVRGPPKHYVLLLFDLTCSNSPSKKRLLKQPKLLFFIIDHGSIKINFNGTTTDFMVYNRINLDRKPPFCNGQIHQLEMKHFQKIICRRIGNINKNCKNECISSLMMIAPF